MPLENGQLGEQRQADNISINRCREQDSQTLEI
jgi:hypothetical protein